ncbi:hypothetical protein SASPL_105531 [Salvia splendens]|uniref:Uncharacterized protein n=1 Tax=Salvia splendens TaxID=180675 RepID=A0A8X8YNS2_SALSN|nr:hypothetical protein SASPL_105531 [Salvia splendens]
MTNSSEPFPAADLEKELHPGSNKEFEVSSAVHKNKQEQEQKPLAERKEQETEDALHNFKKTITISVIVLAFAGAVFAVTKKIREK